MNVIIDFASLRERMFNDQLLDGLLGAYRREMEAADFTLPEDEYLEGKQALAPILSPQQLFLLEQAETLCRENMKYAMAFAFFQGCRAFFQQLFSRKPLEQPFHSLIVEQLLTMPNMAGHSIFYERHNRVQDIYQTLSGELNPWRQEHLTSVESAWDERLYGVLRHAFYLGYCQAMDSVRNCDGSRPSPDFPEMLALIEYELGFDPNRDIPRPD